MHRNGLGSLLPFPLTPVSRQTGTRLVLPLSSSAGDACWVLKMEKLCGLLEGDRRRRWIFYLLVFSCPGFYFTLLFASRWLCLYKPGPLKKRGLRANDVATRALKDMRPTLLLFLQKLECVQAEWTACVFYMRFVATHIAIWE